MMLEENGVRVAAVSYDSQETLAAFAQKHAIGFPLLSDKSSETIRRFGIFNSNMAPDLRAYGVPHPVNYLVAPDGTVLHKYFVPNYLHRVSGSAVALREFGTVNPDAPFVCLESGALTVQISFASATAFAGQELAYRAQFALQPGWHIYGPTVSPPCAATSITFEGPNVLDQRLALPGPQVLNFPNPGEAASVYSGSFQGVGTLLLKHPLPEENLTLSGLLTFQQCSDTVCEPPETLPFELTLTLEPFLISDREREQRQQKGAREQ